MVTIRDREKCTFVQTNRFIDMVIFVRNTIARGVKEVKIMYQ